MNREIRKFHIAVVQQLQRNVQKKHDARAELLFCQSTCTPIAFFAILVSVTVVIAYVPYQPSKLRPF